MNGFVNNVNQEISQKKIRVLVCPLDWGIGHATRMVPVINIFIEKNCEVIIAGSGKSLEFLRLEFPELQHVELKGMNITYSTGSHLVLKILAILPSFFRMILQEKYAVNRIVRKFNIQIIVSDNRYGCRYSGIPSVLVTHQLRVQVPFFARFPEKIIQIVLYHLIRKFDECWIPDFELRKGIAGNLSHPARLPENAFYVGILSRFTMLINGMIDSIPPGIDLLVLLSGPEPQRTILEKLILKQLPGLGLTTVVVQGIPGETETATLPGDIHIFPHLNTLQLLELMARSNLIICRSGYSTIMDLLTVGKRAVLIPTPGQTEQEYLARYLMEKKIYLSVQQDTFDVLYAMELSKNFPGMVIRNDEKDLENRIEILVRKVSNSSGMPGK